MFEGSVHVLSRIVMGLKGKLHKQPERKKEKCVWQGCAALNSHERKKKKRKENERKMAKIDSLNVVSPRETGYRLKR